MVVMGIDTYMGATGKAAHIEKRQTPSKIHVRAKAEPVWEQGKAVGERRHIKVQ